MNEPIGIGCRPPKTLKPDEHPLLAHGTKRSRPVARISGQGIGIGLILPLAVLPSCQAR
jgi:hypothetical protein